MRDARIEAAAATVARRRYPTRWERAEAISAAVRDMRERIEQARAMERRVELRQVAEAIYEDADERNGSR